MNQPITVELVFCPSAALWFTRYPQTQSLTFGVYGQKVGGDYLLKNHDRIEFYRPLPLDPMKLRKQRAMKTKKLKTKKP